MKISCTCDLMRGLEKGVLNLQNFKLEFISFLVHREFEGGVGKYELF